jgi:hypothetical protein
MAAMTAAQMLQGEQNRQKAAKVNEAEVRYGPWTGNRQLASVPNQSMDTAQQGVTGIYGQMQNEKKSSLQDKLTQAQINRLNMLSGKGGVMSQGQGLSPVRGYNMEMDVGGWGGADESYMRQNPWMTRNG